MATPQQGQDQVYLFRLQTLIIDGSTTVIRNIFDQKRPNLPLNVFLRQEKIAIKTLRTRNTITKAQFYLLYPKGGNPPSITDIDLTLATCLLRNLKSFGLNAQFNWCATPQPGDTSLEADLCRLRNSRNEIVHITSTAGINQTTFQKKWTEIEQVLLRLNSSVPNPVQNLQQKIDKYKSNPLDPEAEEKIKEEIVKLQKIEEDFDMELQIVKTNVKDVKGSVEKVKENIEEVKANVKENIEEVRENVEAVREDIAAAHEKIDEELKMRRKKADEPKVAPRKEPNMFQRIQEKIQMRGKKKELREDLIVLYRKQYHTLPLSPLIEEHDTPLIKFYVMPDINTVEHQRSLGGGSESKSEPVTSLRDVFQKKSKTCCEIYLTADAGLGKTAFSKRLVLTWCQAKKGIKSERKHFKEEDIRVMDEFKFVFLLSLRECSEECDIDEMIMKQIIPRLANTSVTLSKLETILCKEKCLVILDGLDEWSHPTSACKQGSSDIPHRKARECTILTTTRPWKLSVISLSSSQIEQKLEIVGLNEESANELKKSVISLLCDRPEITVEKHVDDFDEAIEHRGLSFLETIPLLLMYLLSLWCDGIVLGRSKCELYCQIVELLLKRTFKKYPDMQHADKPPESDIPQCFSEHIHCKNNYSLLKALAQLACERLFNKHKENTLVFDQSDTEKYLSSGNLKLSLFSGILTQSKEVKLTKQSSKVSFSHKSVQEFFCALYISCQNESDVKKIVLQNCSSIQNILDMLTVFAFISGMNAKVISSVSRELMPVISTDKITSTYRSVLSTYRCRAHAYEYTLHNPLKDIQNMYISCFKENPDNNDLKLCCQDLIIDEDCWEESYFTNVRQLAIHNKNNMQSIRISTHVPSVHEIISSCELDDLFNIRIIYYKGDCKEEELCRLFNRPVECVTVRTHGVIFCSSKLCKTFQNNSLLRAIYIEEFKMAHDVMEQFLNCIDRKSMKDIGLRELFCITHGRDSCPGFNLDLSQHSDLRTLELAFVPVTQLEVNVTELEYCDVGGLSKHIIMTSFLRSLPAASKLHTFKCGDLKSSGDIDILVHTLPKLVTVKQVTLYRINLGERSLSLSPEMVNIEFVQLLWVTMPVSQLHDIVKLVEKLPHTVEVDIYSCTITPKTEVEHVRKYLQTSHNFRITEDSNWWSNVYICKFQTIKS